MCDGRNVTGSPFAPLWGWLPMASYMGTGDFELENNTVMVDTYGLSLSVSITVLVVHCTDIVMSVCYWNIELVKCECKVKPTVHWNSFMVILITVQP